MKRLRRGLIASIVVLASSAASAAAQGPYEPDDSIPAAAGPLEAGLSYGASIETATDRDFYSFYMTAPGGATASLTILDEGGGTATVDLEMRIVDSQGTSLGTDVAFLRPGESRTETVALSPGKYFVEVAANEGFGAAYRLSPGGSEGAFGSYGQIAAGCEAATARLSHAAAVLRRAEGRLQRTRSRYRRSRYAGRDVRRKARAELVASKRLVRRAHSKKAAAMAAQFPWCGIPS